MLPQAGPCCYTGTTMLCAMAALGGLLPPDPSRACVSLHSIFQRASFCFVAQIGLFWETPGFACSLTRAGLGARVYSREPGPALPLPALLLAQLSTKWAELGAKGTLPPSTSRHGCLGTLSVLCYPSSNLQHSRHHLARLPAAGEGKARGLCSGSTGGSRV